MKHRAYPVLVCLLLAIQMTILPASAQEETVGTLQVLLPSFTELEAGSNCTAMGCLAADAVRYAAGTEFAIVNAEDVAGTLPQGAITRADIDGAVARDRQLGTAEITAPQLRALLEGCLSQITVDLSDEIIDAAASAYGGFPNVSGFTLRYDASAPAGQRVCSITREDGTALDLEDEATRYTVAASAWLLEGNYGGGAVDYEPAQLSLTQALAGYLSACGSGLTELDWDRVRVIGVSSNTLVGAIPIPILVVSVLILAAVLAVMRLKFQHSRPDWARAEEEREKREGKMR